MDLVVGSWETIVIDVAPYDGSTAASLALYSPASATPVAVPLDGGTATVVDGQAVLRFTSLTPVQYTVSGWWVLAGAVTGVGATPVDRRFFVAPQPVASGPDWTPTLDRVAAYVPGRTLVVNGADGSNTEVATFDSTTRPPVDQVLRLIEGAISWVTAATGPTVDASLYPTATTAAAIYTAACIQRGYPERQSSDQAVTNTTADDLFKQAQDMLTKLAARNDVLIGENPEVFEVLPVWSFPRPELFGDYNFL